MNTDANNAIKTRYLVNVVYFDKDGEEQIAMAIAQTADAQAAIAGVVDVVSNLPRCDKVIGGTCEEVDPIALADFLSAPLFEGESTHPAHTTIN